MQSVRVCWSHGDSWKPEEIEEFGKDREWLGSTEMNGGHREGDLRLKI